MEYLLSLQYFLQLSSLFHIFLFIQYFLWFLPIIFLLLFQNLFTILYLFNIEVNSFTINLFFVFLCISLFFYYLPHFVTNSHLPCVNQTLLNFLNFNFANFSYDLSNTCCRLYKTIQGFVLIIFCLFNDWLCCIWFWVIHSLDLPLDL